MKRFIYIAFAIHTFVCVCSSRCGVVGDEVQYIQRGRSKYLPSADGRLHSRNEIHLDLASIRGNNQFLDASAASLPNIRSIILGGKHFRMSDVDAAARLPNLKIIVLDSVTDAQFNAARMRWPDMQFWESQRSAIEVVRRERNLESFFRWTGNPGINAVASAAGTSRRRLSAGNRGTTDGRSKQPRERH